jgi:catechol 2,3-dioxygenase-like lactoylglutathione lyase family enzyme
LQTVPRLRQAVLAARDLKQTVERLRGELGLREPYRDPGVAHFGLANAVFAIGDTFLEVVSPVDPENRAARTAVRQLERSGADLCGYMAMLQVDELRAARERARAAGVREVFEVELDDMAEVHLHPGDIRGAIVSLSEPQPPESWRWGGPGWNERAADGRLAGIVVAVRDPDAVSERWATVAGGQLPECSFVADERSRGLVEVQLELDGGRETIRVDAR